MSIRTIRERWRWLVGGMFALVATGLVLWVWVVPAGIEWQLRTLYGGKVSISGWWIDGATSGVKNLRLYEEGTSNPPVFATADRVVTDLSIGRLLSGRFEPSRVEMQGLRVTFRVDADGHPLTRLVGWESGDASLRRELGLFPRKLGRAISRFSNYDAKNESPRGDRSPLEVSNEGVPSCGVRGRFGEWIRDQPTILCPLARW